MMRIGLQRAAASLGRIKFIPRMSVIDRQDISASQLWREALDPSQGGEIHFGFVRFRSNGGELSRDAGAIPHR